MPTCVPTCVRACVLAAAAAHGAARNIAGQDLYDLSTAPKDTYNSWELSSRGLKNQAPAPPQGGVGAEAVGDGARWWWWEIPSYRHAYALNADNSILCCSNLGGCVCAAVLRCVAMLRCSRVCGGSFGGVGGAGRGVLEAFVYHTCFADGIVALACACTDVARTHARTHLAAAAPSRQTILRCICRCSPRRQLRQCRWWYRTRR